MPSFFDRFRPEAEAQRRFAGWEPPPSPVPLSWGSDLPAFSPPRPRQTQSFVPALVIGLGDTGEAALRDWLAQLAQSSVGPQSALRAYLIAERPATPLPQGDIPIRQADLVVRVNVAASLTRNRRAEAREQFRQVSVQQPFFEWLEMSARELHHDVRVIIVGSLREPAIGVLGDVLQAIRLAPGNNNAYLAVTALLAMDTPDPAIALDDAEVYAALREVSRFTFRGDHRMEPLPGQPQRIIHSALLDHLFLAEGRGADLAFTAIAEALFTLLHSSAKPIWENLANDLTHSGHEPLAHTFGLAALSVPRRETQAYIAARLARAALCGEHPHRPDEGLFSPSAHTQPHIGKTLVRRWLTSGPAAHPLFEWLLDSDAPAYFRYLPLPAVRFDLIFQANIARGLVALLNDPVTANRGIQSNAALAWLSDWLKQVHDWVNASMDVNHQAFAEMLARWRDLVSHIARQLVEWERVLSTPQSAAIKMVEPVNDWRRSAAPSSNWRGVDTGATVPPVASLPEWLTQRQLESEAILKAAAGGSTRRALTADDSDGLTEIAKYYEDTIRPELSRFGSTDTSLAFRRTRERLGWWVELMAGHLPEIRLVCLPSHLALAAAHPPPPDACFDLNHVEQLGQALLDMTKAQANTIEADLTGPWFRQRLAQLASFLSRSNAPLLTYDANAAIHYPGTATRRSYLIAQDKTLTAAHRAAAFPRVPLDQINEIDGSDPARVTALTFWLNIPLSVVGAIRTAYAKYGHRSSSHLFPQERNAAEYERRWRDLNGDSLVPFPPGFTLALAESQLVTLFCQALFCGLIERIAPTPHEPLCWTVYALDEEFDPLPLASDSLWLALKKFALELPNEPEANTNPAKPFYRERRRQYLETLRNTIRYRQRQPEYKLRRENFRKTTLAEWQRLGQRDPLARALACLLEVELDEPLWTGW